MQLTIALENFILLETLPEYTKIWVESSTQKLFKDERWVRGIRRRWAGHSRQDLIDPISNTFQIIRATESYPDTRIVKCVQHVRNTLSVLYPDFTDLTNLLNDVEYESQEDEEDCSKSISRSAPPPRGYSAPPKEGDEIRGSNLAETDDDAEEDNPKESPNYGELLDRIQIGSRDDDCNYILEDESITGVCNDAISALCGGKLRRSPPPTKFTPRTIRGRFRPSMNYGYQEEREDRDQDESSEYEDNNLLDAIFNTMDGFMNSLDRRFSQYVN